MKKLMLIAVVLGWGLAASAAGWGGTWSFVTEWHMQPFSISSIDGVLTLWYRPNNFTFSSTSVISLNGLENVYFDVKGAIGAFALRGILDLDAARPAFGSSLFSVATGFAGVNLFSLFMIDDVNQAGAIGTGFTFGIWQETRALSIWAAVRSNMNSTVRYIYQYGYNWLLDHFIFKWCDLWFKPSGYIDVLTSSSVLTFTGADVYVEVPMQCFTLLAQFSVTHEGFASLLLEARDIDLGLPIPFIRWVDVLFTTDSKAVTVVFDMPTVGSGCLTPYLVFEVNPVHPTVITGLGLKALLLKYKWNGFSFKAGHMFDENGWYPYANYYGTRVYGFTWDGELATDPVCVVTQGYDEFIGLEVKGQACCGGGYSFSAFAWFDTGNSPGIFDWVETRIMLRTAISNNAELLCGASITTSGANWVRFGFSSHW